MGQIDWENPDTLATCSFLFNQMLVFLLGMFLWHFILTFSEVEGGLLMRRLTFKFPYVPYFIGRYSTLVTLVMLVLVTHWRSTVAFNCGALMRLLSVLGDISVVMASANLLTRALSLWRGSRFTLVFLIILGLGQLALGISVGVRGIAAEWDPALRTCKTGYAASRADLISFYTYTIIWDLLILTFTLTGLYRQAPQSSGTNRLATMVRAQGLWYVLVTLISNIPVLVLMLLNLNPVMSVIFTTPACTISVIASSAAVTSLLHVYDNRPALRTQTCHGHHHHHLRHVNRDLECGGSTGLGGKSEPQLTTHIEFPGDSLETDYPPLPMCAVDPQSASLTTPGVRGEAVDVRHLIRTKRESEGEATLSTNDACSDKKSMDFDIRDRNQDNTG